MTGISLPQIFSFFVLYYIAYLFRSSNFLASYILASNLNCKVEIIQLLTQSIFYLIYCSIHLKLALLIDKNPKKLIHFVFITLILAFNTFALAFLLPKFWSILLIIISHLMFGLSISGTLPLCIMVFRKLEKNNHFFQLSYLLSNASILGGLTCGYPLLKLMKFGISYQLFMVICSLCLLLAYVPLLRLKITTDYHDYEFENCSYSFGDHIKNAAMCGLIYSSIFILLDTNGFKIFTQYTPQQQAFLCSILSLGNLIGNISYYYFANKFSYKSTIISTFIVSILSLYLMFSVKMPLILFSLLTIILGHNIAAKNVIMLTKISKNNAAYQVSLINLGIPVISLILSVMKWFSIPQLAIGSLGLFGLLAITTKSR